jgi:hypothetical protein
MDTGTIVQIIGVVLVLLVPICGWLISTVISQGKELAAQEAANQIQFKATANSCQECQKNFDRRICDGSKESDRRFAEITEWLKKIEEKLDKALQRTSNNG